MKTSAYSCYKDDVPLNFPGPGNKARYGEINSNRVIFKSQVDMSHKRLNPKNSFTPLKTLIDGIMRQYRPLPGQDLAQVWEVWESAVGPSIAENARPAAFKGNLLLVHVANPTWAHHLRFMEKELISKLNQALGSERVAMVKYKIGPV